MKPWAALFLVAVTLAGPAPAQEAADTPTQIPFQGGMLTVTESSEGDKVLAFDGVELARNYVVNFDRSAEVGGTQVALFSVGDGGNQCGPATVIVWKPDGSEVRSEAVGEDDCGSPPAAVAEFGIYFVPYLLPGETKHVGLWSANAGLEVAGSVAYTPQPGTGWDDLDRTKLDNIVDALKNEAVYKAALDVLGPRITEVVTGLLTGGGTEDTPSGVFYASGCVPHACGSADAFMAIDPRQHKVYFAQEGDTPEPSAWPPLKTWPAEVRAAMIRSLQE